jgi:hypothetical protein
MSLATVIFVSLVTTTVGQSSSTADTSPAPQSAQAAQAQTQTQSQTQAGSASTDASKNAKANASTKTSTGEALPVSLDRIRKALDDAPAASQDAPKLKIDTTNVPVFRTQTEGTAIKLSHVLDDGTNVGAYVHPQYGPYDYEFKQMVTPDALKGCGRWSQAECIQSYANQAATALLWNYATQKRKPAPPSAPPPPDPETQRIRAQIQQELLDQQSSSASTPPSKP